MDEQEYYNDKYDEYYGQDEDLIVCAYCGHEFHGTPEKHCEGTDADGNRGVWVYYIDCPECEEELAWEGGFCGRQF